MHFLSLSQTIAIVAFIGGLLWTMEAFVDFDKKHKEAGNRFWFSFIFAFASFYLAATLWLP